MSLKPTDIHVPKDVLKANIQLLYQDVLFHSGSDIRWVISYGNTSLFTDDSALAERLDFRRIDKFEYEKTISVDEIQAAYVTLDSEDAEQTAMTPQQFKAWLHSFI